jgi:hypothetical protein
MPIAVKKRSPSARRAHPTDRANCSVEGLLEKVDRTVL